MTAVTAFTWPLAWRVGNGVDVKVLGAGDEGRPIMIGADWLAAARDRLSPIAEAQASREARLILGHVTGWSAAQVAIGGPRPLTESEHREADLLLDRRLGREPLAQILGAWDFYGRRFRVTRETLVPRPDTESLIDKALAAPFSSFLDLGTGSGAIAVTLLAERPRARGVATDISPAALSVAAENAARMEVSDRLELLHADWWQGVAGRFDLVVSNPPYVAERDYADLAPEVTQWEPRCALTPGGDGLSAYRAIASGLPQHLAPGGRCVLEIGTEQGEAVAAMLRDAGLDAVTVHTDMTNRPRVVSGQMRGRHGDE